MISGIQMFQNKKMSAINPQRFSAHLLYKNKKNDFEENEVSESFGECSFFRLRNVEGFVYKEITYK